MPNIKTDMLHQIPLSSRGSLAHPVLFDPRSDVLFVPDVPALIPLLGRLIASKLFDDSVRHLAIGGDWDDQVYKILVAFSLQAFSNLKHLIFVKSTGVCDAAFVESTMKYYPEFMKEHFKWEVSDPMDWELSPPDIRELWKSPGALLWMRILNQNRHRNRD